MRNTHLHLKDIHTAILIPRELRCNHESRNGLFGTGRSRLPLNVVFSIALQGPTRSNNTVQLPDHKQASGYFKRAKEKGSQAGSIGLFEK